MFRIGDHSEVVDFVANLELGADRLQFKGSPSANSPRTLSGSVRIAPPGFTVPSPRSGGAPSPRQFATATVSSRDISQRFAPGSLSQAPSTPGTSRLTAEGIAAALAAVTGEAPGSYLAPPAGPAAAALAAAAASAAATAASRASSASPLAAGAATPARSAIPSTRSVALSGLLGSTSSSSPSGPAAGSDAAIGVARSAVPSLRLGGLSPQSLGLAPPQSQPRSSRVSKALGLTASGLSATSDGGPGRSRASTAIADATSAAISAASPHGRPSSAAPLSAAAATAAAAAEAQAQPDADPAAVYEKIMSATGSGRGRVMHRLLGVQGLLQAERGTSNSSRGSSRSGSPGGSVGAGGRSRSGSPGGLGSGSSSSNSNFIKTAPRVVPSDAALERLAAGGRVRARAATAASAGNSPAGAGPGRGKGAPGSAGSAAVRLPQPTRPFNSADEVLHALEDAEDAVRRLDSGVAALAPEGGVRWAGVSAAAAAGGSAAGVSGGDFSSSSNSSSSSTSGRHPPPPPARSLPSQSASSAVAAPAAPAMAPLSGASSSIAAAAYTSGPSQGDGQDAAGVALGAGGRRAPSPPPRRHDAGSGSGYESRYGVSFDAANGADAEDGRATGSLSAAAAESGARPAHTSSSSVPLVTPEERELQLGLQAISNALAQLGYEPSPPPLAMRGYSSSSSSSSALSGAGETGIYSAALPAPEYYEAAAAALRAQGFSPRMIDAAIDAHAAQMQGTHSASGERGRGPRRKSAVAQAMDTAAAAFAAAGFVPAGSTIAEEDGDDEGSASYAGSRLHRHGARHRDTPPMEAGMAQLLARLPPEQRPRARASIAQAALVLASAGRAGGVHADSMPVSQEVMHAALEQALAATSSASHSYGHSGDAAADDPSLQLALLLQRYLPPGALASAWASGGGAAGFGLGAAGVGAYGGDLALDALGLSADARARVAAAADSELAAARQAAASGVGVVDPLLAQYGNLPWPYNVAAIIEARRAAEDEAIGLGALGDVDASDDGDEADHDDDGDRDRDRDAASSRRGRMSVFSALTGITGITSGTAGTGKSSRRRGRGGANGSPDRLDPTAAPHNPWASPLLYGRERFVRNDIYIPPLPPQYRGYGGKGPLPPSEGGVDTSMASDHPSGLASFASFSGAGSGAGAGAGAGSGAGAAGLPASVQRSLTTQSVLHQVAVAQAQAQLLQARADALHAQAQADEASGQLASERAAAVAAAAEADAAAAATHAAEVAAAGQAAAAAAAGTGSGASAPATHTEASTGKHQQQQKELRQHYFEQQQQQHALNAAAAAGHGQQLPPWAVLPAMLHDAGMTVVRLQAAGLLSVKDADGALRHAHPPLSVVGGGVAAGGSPYSSGSALARGGYGGYGAASGSAGPSGADDVSGEHVRGLLERHLQQMESRATEARDRHGDGHSGSAGSPSRLGGHFSAGAADSFSGGSAAHHAAAASASPSPAVGPGAWGWAVDPATGKGRMVRLASPAPVQAPAGEVGQHSPFAARSGFGGYGGYGGAATTLVVENGVPVVTSSPGLPHPGRHGDAARSGGAFDAALAAAAEAGYGRGPAAAPPFVAPPPPHSTVGRALTSLEALLLQPETAATIRAAQAHGQAHVQAQGYPVAR